MPHCHINKTTNKQSPPSTIFRLLGCNVKSHLIPFVGNKKVNRKTSLLHPFLGKVVWKLRNYLSMALDLNFLHSKISFFLKIRRNQFYTCASRVTTFFFFYSETRIRCSRWQLHILPRNVSSTVWRIVSLTFVECLTLSPLHTVLVQSRTMNGRVHWSYLVLKGLINI